MHCTIDCATLKNMLDSGNDFHLAEVLAEKEFNRLHVKGAGA